MMICTFAPKYPTCAVCYIILMDTCCWYVYTHPFSTAGAIHAKANTWDYIDDLAQADSNSIAYPLELLHYCTKPSACFVTVFIHAMPNTTWNLCDHSQLPAVGNSVHIIYEYVDTGLIHTFVLLCMQTFPRRWKKVIIYIIQLNVISAHFHTKKHMYYLAHAIGRKMLPYI